jgi:hypothetical protein
LLVEEDSRMKETERARFRNPERSRSGDAWEQLTEAEREVERLAESAERQVRTAYTPVVYEYWAPFNYPNIRVELGRGVPSGLATEPYTGAEYNVDGVELDFPPYGAITVVEEEPIVGVTVIGSACIPPGYVLLQAEPLAWKYPRTGVKMRIDGLWGQHLRAEPWSKGIDESWRDAGLSAARFELPESKKVTIMAGSTNDISELDVSNQRQDAHYAVRIIRVTVKRPA